MWSMSSCGASRIFLGGGDAGGIGRPWEGFGETERGFLYGKYYLNGPLRKSGSRGENMSRSRHFI